jgi:cardiolipin synthase (CMP-forming)
MSQLDGFLARRYRMTSVLGTILDPAADKALVGTLVVTLTMQGLLPGELSTPEEVTQFSCPS